MAISRYNLTTRFFNDDRDYKKVFKERFGDLDSIKQLETLQLKYPEFDDILNLNYQNHIWKLGDRLYKLSHTYYSDPSLWWVIAWFNKKPTEQHIEIGELIKIPLPINDVLNSFGL